MELTPTDLLEVIRRDIYRQDPSGVSVDPVSYVGAC